MSKRYGVEEARIALPEILRSASNGQTVLVTKHGRPYAKIGPLDDRDGRRRMSILSLRGSGTGVWGKDVRKAVAALRDEWER